MIVSVSAFSKLLIDQIAEKLAFLAVKKDIRNQNITMDTNVKNRPLIDRAAEAFIKFLHEYVPKHSAETIRTETQLLGALGGFLSSIEYDISVFTNQRTSLTNDRFLETDMLLSHGSERIVVELKRSTARQSREYGLRHLEIFLSNTDASGGILLIYGDDQATYHVDTYETAAGKTIRIIEPSATPSRSE